MYLTDARMEMLLHHGYCVPFLAAFLGKYFGISEITTVRTVYTLYYDMWHKEYEESGKLSGTEAQLHVLKYEKSHFGKL